MAKEKIKRRLLSFPDGDRRLTSLLQLTEIFHRESIEKNLGMTGLLKWIFEKKTDMPSAPEEHLLRLESDEDAVKIITIHKSKGLEYPVVFCPYGWEGSLIKDSEITFHDTDENSGLTLDLGSENRQKHIMLAQNERLAENIRLLYVALTRAKKICYLVWGRINTAETSAMAYLLHGRTIRDHERERLDWKKNDIVSLLKNSFSAKRDEDLLEEIKQLASESEGTIEPVPMPLEGVEHSARKEKKEKRFPRKFSGEIDKTWRISSYSSLVSRQPMDIDRPDRDLHHDAYRRPPMIEAASSAPPDVRGKKDIFSFPKGARAGIFFHDIFEHLDFESKDPDHLANLVAVKLKGYGFERSWGEAVCHMIENVISTPLLKHRKDFVLSSISREDRINEMEFYFPLRSITPEKLKNIFNERGGVDVPSDVPIRLGKLVFAPSKGFMKGYIDMIFRSKGRYYLVDWKSNYLGPRIEDYHQDLLDEVMMEDYYILQCQLYTLAVHLYLRLRMPGYNYKTHFGGAFYIFMRGMEPGRGPESGIYSDLPSLRLIDALEESLVHFPV
jgi:exodeoxyribonuclease V beta subunit